MNNLEKEIEEYIYQAIKGKEPKDYIAGVCAGVELILQKKIHISFYKWMDTLDYSFICEFSNHEGITDYDKLSDYYFENIYGKI